ncbi:probable E3 ubiquitin-protein ligase HERC3 isoform X1 [Megalobrama amblycephala]|uniref:probable E3 ubiquitin-protein ligase HERC3 isoform X1 n=2 Tax=Megalobrama amblycephala TaxID=75352 RepID=UPI002013EFC4|nr:probable E3 ubiquitin-protein ligase HERC3 isoform X1 [Megalobrama amblycephala]
MLCYWGAPVREGFGLLKPDKVKHGNNDIRSMCPKSAEDMSAGRSFVGFIRNGKVSVLRLRGENYDHDGKLEQLQLKNNIIRSIVCGGAGAVLLADAGRVLVMDKSTVCRHLKGLENRQVIQITCGDQHSMALTKDGQLFVWGENSHGQLGLRKEHPGSPSAQQVKSLCGIPLAQISAGGDHSFVLSLSGVVFGWGKNSAGQLGLGDTTDRHVPTVVNSLNRKKTVSISCGGEHTATLSKGGTVFTFGSGGFGQLGHNSFKDEHHPRVVAELWGSKVSQVTCGRRHTLVSVSSSKLIYSFGCGMQGQLGNGEMIKQSVPLPVDLSNECDHEYMIEKLIAGENHSFALFFKELESKPKSTLRGVLTLNDRMIDRWVSESDSWATIKNEIYAVFSSAASLNGSFLKTSCDEHYQTSVENCGLDFDLVKTSFAKLSENERLISEVMKVVHNTLLPYLNSNPTGVEALRLYLLLPELIRGLQKKKRTELTGALASKILQLKPAARKMLEMYWSKLPDDWLKGLVKLFHKESAELIGQISCGKTGYILNRRLKNFLQILQMLYEVCCSIHNDITNSDFIIHEVNDLIVTLQVTLKDLAMSLLGLCFTEDADDLVTLKDYYFGIIEILVKFPFAADTQSKQRMFCYLQMRLQFSPDREKLTLNDNVLHVNRESLLTDTLKYLRQNTHSFYHPLEVVFIGENGIDWRGLSAEFFTLLPQSLLKWEKKVLEVQENSLVWFNPDHTEDNKDFYYLGVICGMALYNHHYMDINFPLALFKKLLKLSPTLNDLEELSPVEAGSLKNLLEEDEDVVDILFLDFTVRGQELIPNGGQIQVNKVNRQKYVDLYVDFVFNKSVKNQFKHFSRGFSEGCPLDIWSMFHPEELQELLQGSPKYEWKELQTSASYESCSASDELIKNFWTVFFEFSEENKKKILMFLYGTDRVPVGGFSKRPLKICQSDGPDPDDRLPEAQTCFGRLILPKYSDINTLRNKLVHAINFCEVFGRG